MPVLTAAALAEALAALGVAGGDTLLVHTRMSALGHVIGGARGVCDGLRMAVGAGGTIMMPAFSGDLSDPAGWGHPAIDPADVARVTAAVAPYDRRLTPTRGVGVVAEYFRHLPGAMRSNHPMSSFAAHGPNARRLTGLHGLDDRFGPASPLAALRDVRGKVLMLGAPDNTCSLFYLLQYEAGAAPAVHRYPLHAGWVTARDVALTDAGFGAALAHLLDEGVATQGPVGAATCLLFDVKRAMDALGALP